MQKTSARKFHGAPPGNAKSYSNPRAFERVTISAFGTFRTWRDVRFESVMRLKADIGQAFVLDLNSVLARTLAECPVDGRTPNSKCLCDGRRADALLLERPHL